jgi:hypothetical protein
MTVYGNGPINDNVGERIRERTDALDAGNRTAAIGKVDMCLPFPYYSSMRFSIRAWLKFVRDVISPQ